MTERLPPDRNQCQALRPNKSWSPFALGPAHVDPVTGEKRGGSRNIDRHWRCREKPVCIVMEATPDEEDGQTGSMSLCKECYIQCCLQMGDQILLAEVLDADFKKDSI